MNTNTRTVVCPHCRTKLRTAAAPQKQVRCPRCLKPFQPTTAAQAVLATKVVCGTCQTKLKGVKPGAKYKCPKCGSIERAAPAANAEKLKAPAPVPAKKPARKPMKPVPQAETKQTSDVTDQEPEPRTWKPQPVHVPSPRTIPSKATTPATSSRGRRRDEESTSGISGKLLTTLIVIVLVGVIVGAWSLLGGDSGLGRAAIAGEVSIDGTPVEVGSILFSPLDEQAKSLAVPAAKIEGGRYKIAREQGPGVGMCKIIIRVPKKSGRQVQKFLGGPGELEDEIIEGAAERFNARSELTFQVKAGSNTANFEVSAR